MASKETLMSQLFKAQQELLDLELYTLAPLHVQHTDNDDLIGPKFTAGPSYWTVSPTDELAEEVRVELELVDAPSCTVPYGNSRNPYEHLYSKGRVVALRIWAPKLGIVTAYPTPVWSTDGVENEPVQVLKYRTAQGRHGDCASVLYNSIVSEVHSRYVKVASAEVSNKLPKTYIY